MKDFLLDSNGDLEFESESQSDASKFEFNFHIATSDSLLFNFSFFWIKLHKNNKLLPRKSEKNISLPPN